MEGGRHGHSGRIDILATDVKGNVWLIEAKEGCNSELRADLWESQVLPYRDGLRQTSSEDIILRSERYLKGDCRDMAPPDFIPENCNSLLDVFTYWVKHLRMDPCEDKAKNLYNRTFSQMADGDVILTVLSDVICPEVWDNRPNDLPSAFIKCSGSNDQFAVEVLLDGHPKLGSSIRVPEVSAWSQLRVERRREKVTPQILRDVISEDVAGLYEYLLSELKDMGWDGALWLTNIRSFGIRLITRYEKYVYLDIGKPDKDSRDLNRSAKLDGTAGFKCDVTFMNLNNDDSFREVAFHSMRRLINEAGYRVKGAINLFIEREVDHVDVGKTDFQLTHRRDGKKRDFIGRFNDRSDIEKMLKIIRDLL